MREYFHAEGLVQLLASSLLGGLYLIILFCLCFGLVVGGKLARRYFFEQKSQAPPQPEPKKPDDKPAERREQRVYYIVEKKKVRRTPEKYSEPKRIRFD